MTTDEQLFFTTPDIFKNGKVSTLHLLRRDIYTCLGKPCGQINADIGTNQPFVIWPGVMTIMTGIDLIAKFYIGNVNDKEMSYRFNCYVKKYISPDAEEIFQLRNALLHGFSLYSKYKKKEWRYVLGRHAENILWHGEDNKIYVSADQLHKAFERSITLFQKEYSTLNSYSSFNDLFEKYGWTTI